jgi:probable phosphomutase (TIGR03848 family)
MAKPKPPKPTLVLFVRHGQTSTTGKVLPGRAKGLHLADAGRAQAQRAADRIGALSRVDAIYSSPMERTRETAKPISVACSTSVVIHRGLNECDFGEWTGRELKDLYKLPEWKTIQSHPSGFRFPGGESFTEMQTRIGGAVADIIERHSGQTIVVVSHADPIKAAVADAMGSHLDQFQRIVISPCSITAVLYPHGTAPIVLSVNSTGDDLASLVVS